MTPDRIRGERMARQHLIGERHADVTSAVRHLTAVQAQEFDDACRAVARRVEGWPAAAEVAREAAEGAIVRHHVLRPTWHFVLAEDLDWMLDLTAERVHAKARPQRRAHGIADDVDRLVGLVGEVLAAADEPLTRKEIGAALAARGVSLTSGALGHVTLAAELDKVAVTAARRGSWDTYVPYRSRIPESAAIDRDEAVARLAARYLGSHAPATAEDFAWWSGLTLTDARRGIAAADAVESPRGSATGTAMLLSLFDEYVIAYTDREIYAAPTQRGTLDVWGGDLVLVGGVVVGTWRLRKPKRRDDLARVEITPTAPIGSADRDLLEEDAHAQLEHHDTDYEISWKESA